MRVLSTLIIPILLASQLFGINEEEKAERSRADINDIEKFFYEQGLKVGYNDGYEEGYISAIREAKKALNKYKLVIKAREAGKYFSEEEKITYPEVYSIKTNGGISVQVRGCKIEREFTTADILRAPLAMASELGNGNMDMYAGDSSDKEASLVSNSVYIKKRDESVRSEIPMLPGNEVKRSSRQYQNTTAIRQALDKNNVVYSASDTGIKAIFTSERSAELFENEYKLKR